VLVEYEEGARATTLSWTKSYVYAGSRLLSTTTKTGSTETTEYHHPDRLGTKLITTATTAKEQSTLPYGTVITSETTASTNQKFTSYDRSDKTGLDYAVNRTYSSEQARFLQPDPIGMASVDLTDPQSLNMYTYAGNNPIDFTDPTGLYGGAIISNCRIKCWETSVEILDDGDGSGALFSNVGSSSGCSMTCSVSWVLVQPISPPSERGGGYGGGGRVQDQDPDEGCNKKIAALFGGKGAEVATRLDMLRRLGKFYGKILIVPIICTKAEYFTYIPMSRETLTKIRLYMCQKVLGSYVQVVKPQASIKVETENGRIVFHLSYVESMKV
jgi:RHS repeat-associated protein